ncbi:AAA family ATPase [Flavobacterium collinsii]|uniref:ATPase_AAA_core domain-containing protein n=1 Tax=Flavobacterium collinsii TaxID=1114861 RepID=A0A9W4TJF4_9FLAO|nr:AAA family ATPase [Flavobacterium collinsii]CAI2768168.1 ATPase_AAA_core domain-containing protein [Flavobacterium collinsii]
MKTIDFIGLKNFRTFNDQEGILLELSAINLVTGSNNTGKSSIIKSLQMIKNSIKSTKIPFDLDLTEQEHLLGDFDNVLFNAQNKNIEVTLPFTFLGLTTFYATLEYNISTKDSYKGNLRKITINDKKDNNFLFSFSYRKASETEKKSDQKEFEIESQEYEQKRSSSAHTEWYKLIAAPPTYSPLEGFIDWSINLDKLRSSLEYILEFYKQYLERKKEGKLIDIDYVDSRSEKTSLIPSLLLKSFKPDIPVDAVLQFLETDVAQGGLTQGNEPLREDDLRTEVDFEEDPKIEQLLYFFSIKILNQQFKWQNTLESGRSYFVISESFESSYRELIKRIGNIHFLSTVKEENSRVYSATINSPFTNLVKDYHTNLQEIDTKFIKKYLEAFGIGTEIQVDYERKYQFIKLSIKTLQGHDRELVDFGYGIKQLILILMQISVLAVKNKKKREVQSQEGDLDQEVYYLPSMLIIEEPETNLHPKWQSLLAKLFVKANKSYNIQFVIETHSEYLIRKFQTLTAKNKLKSKAVKIFYLRAAEKVKVNRKQLETIFIKKDGSIKYKVFDGGFFDEADKLELSLLNVQRDNFFRDFQSLKLEKADSISLITDLQTEIDNYTKKANLSVYQNLVDTIFVDSSKLLPDTVRYLTTGQYLHHNINDHDDFSSVIVQYGRSIENELCDLFTRINNSRRWTINDMQKVLERFKSIIPINSPREGQLNTEVEQILAVVFNSPLHLKIELIENLRVKRNGAAHPGPLITKQDALDYIHETNDFLKKWIELKR